MERKLPIPYKVILDKLQKDSWKGEISIKEVRLILNFKFRMGRENLQSIINEMDRMKLIKFKKQGVVKILWKVK
ncbi:hypothetical protein LCGC14_0538190 [marine sediment metagenome]|uniref:Uncharacterized protein n=1 Tax=marine sediment metagenome TaxID=412755 RepID=A0A0F9UF24_9ZZZZ